MAKNLKEFKEALENEIINSSKVFIIGHNGPDFDSIGSAVGLYAIVTHFHKKAYIIVNEADDKIEPGVKKILDDHNARFKIINNQEFEELTDENSLLILTDVNKDDRISIGDKLDLVGSIAIIDHHNEDEHTIPTEVTFIDENISSASEIVARLLGNFKVKYGEDIANFLLAGINLDTGRFKKNSTSKTHDVAKTLINNGANSTYINNLFLEEFESYCRISNLIINGTVIKKYSETMSPIQISFTLNRNNPKAIYSKEDYAKTADRMMKFKGIDASFTLGYVDPKTIHISARGGQRVNVGKIMQKLNGGGNPQSAGGRVESDDIFEIEEQLMDKVLDVLSEEESTIENPKVIKVKQIRRS